jgi:hypothetical protein
MSALLDVFNSTAAAFTRPADTTAYAAQDVVSDSTTTPSVLVFPGAAETAGGSGRITLARHLKSSTVTPATYRLHLYNSRPAAIADNSPFTLLYANRNSRIGFIDFTHSASGTGSDSTNAMTIVAQRGLPYTCAFGDTNLYGVLVDTTGGTPVSSEKHFIGLGFEPCVTPVSPWAANNIWRLARAVPLLDMPLAENRSLVDSISGNNLVTFTCNSASTVVDSNRMVQTVAANQPAFAFDPVTGASLGLQVQEQRTNLLLRSEEFDNATWTKTGSSVTANADTAPDGTSTADRLVEDTSTGGHVVVQSVAGLPDNTQCTASIFVKASSRNWAVLTFVDKAGILNRVWFDVANGVQGATNGTVASFLAVQFPDGWWRLILTASTGTGASTPQVRVSMAAADNTVSYAGNGTSGLLLWGGQLEAGSSATSYTPTGSGTVARSATVADILDQAIANNIRSLYLEFRSPATGIRGVVSLNDGTANERTSVLTNGTTPRLASVDGGVTQSDITAGAVTANALTRVAVRFNTDSFAFSINGAATATDSSGTLPTVDRIFLGRTQLGDYLNGNLARVVGWSTPLSNSVLQLMTQS